MTESHAHSGDGKPDAKILVVGEAWGTEEERVRIPFSGTSGQELNRMLHEAGIQRSECYLTNLVNARPPHNDITKWIAQKRSEITMDMVRLREEYVKPIVREGYQRMLREIALVNPNIVIALGNSALWSLTGAKGILKWRGSQLNLEVPPTDWPADLITPSWVPPRPKLIPTIHPAAVLRDMSLRSIVIHDLKRAAREATSTTYSNVPNWKFTVRPRFEEAQAILLDLIRRADAAGGGAQGSHSGDTGSGGLWVDFDLETRAGHIACAGISWSREEALSIPFMCVESREGYWLEEQEVELVTLLHRLLTHRNVRVRGQNLLYDCQYTYRHWHFVPRVAQDTMISHHSAFAGLPKSLAYQASMYCDHYVYWKDDGKTWDKNVGEDQLWRYNCVDCVRTREVGEGSAETIKQLGLEKVDEFQQKMFWPVLQCMQRGVAVNKKLREKLAAELFEEMAAREELFQAYLGHPLNPKSPLQMSKLFYEDLKQQPVFTRAKNGVPGHLTCNDEALQTIAKREPLLRPLIKAIGEYRSLGVFLSTFVLAPLDIDGRMRTSYNICGTESFRFNSSENAFGSGTNLQNVPAGDESDDDFKLPNVRKIFVPDQGFTMFDKDLSKADLRIVTWEADEPEMKAMLKEGKDPYVEIAREFYKDPTIKKTRSDGSADPRYKTFKSFAHGTHYLGTPYGLAGRLGLSVPVAERTQRWYFERFPRIKAWQADFSRALASRRYVENIFGYRRYYFGRIDEATCREAIAWLPQSTVALYINRIWLNIYERYPQIWVLLQVHDSLVGQFPTHLKAQALRDLDEASQIVLPYDDPLIIPSGTKLSEVSWGDCE